MRDGPAIHRPATVTARASRPTIQVHRRPFPAGPFDRACARPSSANSTLTSPLISSVIDTPSPVSARQSRHPPALQVSMHLLRFSRSLPVALHDVVSTHRCSIHGDNRSLRSSSGVKRVVGTRTMLLPSAAAWWAIPSGTTVCCGATSTTPCSAWITAHASLVPPVG